MHRVKRQFYGGYPGGYGGYPAVVLEVVIRVDMVDIQQLWSWPVVRYSLSKCGFASKSNIYKAILILKGFINAISVAGFLFHFCAKMSLLATVIIFLHLPGIDWSKGLAVGTLKNSENAANYQIMTYFVMFMEITGVLFFLFYTSGSLWCRGTVRDIRTIVLKENVAVLTLFQSNSKLRKH
uniref:Uncharacterized protein n=1 Tax=Ditylenchus dipsaci TaxID=166011 RepID=A0A915DGM8_9BILA